MARPFPPALCHPHAGISPCRGSKPEEGMIIGILHVLLELWRDRDRYGDRGCGFAPSDTVDGPDAHARAGPAVSVRGYLDPREVNSCYLRSSRRRNHGLRSGSARSRPMAEIGQLRSSKPTRVILLNIASLLPGSSLCGVFRSLAVWMCEVN